jgi:transposase
MSSLRFDTLTLGLIVVWLERDSAQDPIVGVAAKAPTATERGHEASKEIPGSFIEGLAFDAPISDKAFDTNAIIADLDARGAKVVISQHPRRASPLAIDLEMYKWRHLIENFFGKLKEFKRIAPRADTTDQSFAAMVHLAAAVINSL